MKIIGKLTAIAPIQEGVSRAGNPYKRCEVIIAFGENHEDSITATLLNDNCNFIDKYDQALRPEVVADVRFTVRDSYGFSGRKYNEILVRSIEMVNYSNNQ